MTTIRSESKFSLSKGGRNFNRLPLRQDCLYIYFNKTYQNILGRGFLFTCNSARPFRRDKTRDKRVWFILWIIEAIYILHCLMRISFFLFLVWNSITLIHSLLRCNEIFLVAIVTHKQYLSNDLRTSCEFHRFLASLFESTASSYSRICTSNH